MSSKGYQLFSACYFGNLIEVKRLVNNGVNVEWSNIGMTPLMIAATMGHEEIVRFLLHHNANIYARNKNGQTAMRGAARNGRCEIVSLLIERGADLHMKDNLGKTTLDYAKQYILNMTGSTAKDLARRNDRISTISILETTIKSTKGKKKRFYNHYLRC